MKNIIVRMKGGLGNQLFQYAFAKRLSEINKCELIIDNITCFEKYEYLYNRRYALNNFNIKERFANLNERLEPFEKIRRNFLNFKSKFYNFNQKFIYTQESLNFDSRFMDLRINKSIILDGSWQSEEYFKDFELIIRNDLKFKNIIDEKNTKLLAKIKSTNSISLHIRSHGYRDPNKDIEFNANSKYYLDSIKYIKKHIAEPHFFIFSDSRSNVNEIIDLSSINHTIVNSNNDESDAYKDLYLMTHCNNFIIAASTFSWWGAWLSNKFDKIIIAPKFKIINKDGTSAWGFKGLLPDKWIKL